MVYNLDCIKDDQNAAGNDLPDMPVTATSAGDCQNRCRSNADCKYFSYRATDGGCWLKTSGDTLAGEEGIVSGPMPCAAENEDARK